MRLNKLQTPKMNKDGAFDKRYGHCQECGKIIMLRNCDGMIRKHGRDQFGLWCMGSLMTPSKAAQSMLVKEWTPPRRSN